MIAKQRNRGWTKTWFRRSLRRRDSVQVALTTYAGLFGKEESETKLRSILEASYPVAAG